MKRLSDVMSASVIAMTAGALALGALTAGWSGSAAAGDPIKIGIMAPFTGPAARTGEQFKDAYVMLVEDTRASGDLPVKVDGTERDIEFVWVDSESSPEKGVKAVQRAIQRDGIEILAGGWHSSVGLAVIDVAMSEDIIAWAILPATVGISNKINDNNYTRWFKGWPAVGPMAALYVDRVHDFIDKGLWSPRTMKAALASEDTDWGHDWNDGVKGALEARGWEVVSVDVVKLDETEHRALLTKYKAADVSLVGFTISGAAAASSFVKQHQEAEIGGLLLADGPGWFPNWYEMAGDATNYAVTMDSPRVITPEQEAWAARYEERFGYAPSAAPSGLVYDYGRMLINAMNESGTVEDKDKLADTLLKSEYTGIWQHYAFAQTAGDKAVAHHEIKSGGFMEGFSFPMVQHIGDQALVVYPFEHAKAEFQAPPN